MAFVQGWARRKRRPVPTFDQLITSCGPSDIGIHLDVFKMPNIRQGVSENGQSILEEKRPVHTYLTALQGQKYVIIVPPSEGAKKLYEVFRTSSRLEEFLTPHLNAQEYKDLLMPTPQEDIRLYLQVHALGGFCFLFSGLPEVDEDEEMDREDEEQMNHVTLVMPRGHYHWLLNLSPFALLFSQSQF